MSNKTIHIEPCPWCGEIPSIKKVTGTTQIYVICRTEGCLMNKPHIYYINLWNDRKTIVKVPKVNIGDECAIQNGISANHKIGRVVDIELAYRIELNPTEQLKHKPFRFITLTDSEVRIVNDESKFTTAP